MKYHYFKSCVDTRGREVDWLRDMIDDGREITWRTFIKHVPVDEIRGLFPYYHWRGGGLHIKDDWGVQFFRSKWNGRRCYYLNHSSIEYIFLTSSF